VQARRGCLFAFLSFASLSKISKPVAPSAFQIDILLIFLLFQKATSLPSITSACYPDIARSLLDFFLTQNPEVHTA
jgi:hypothetical protein